MEENTTSNTSNIIVSIIFVAILLAVLLLVISILFPVINTAGVSVSGLTGYTVTNESGGYINSTGYTLSIVNADSGATSFAITRIYNDSTAQVISAGNYTLSAGGVLKNATSTVWNNVKISYSYSSTNSTASTGILTVQGNIVAMVVNFFSLMPTIGTILAVIILIAGIVLLVIYVRRMKDGGVGSAGSNGEYYG